MASRMTPVTLWWRFNPDHKVRAFEFNHLEDGHCDYGQRRPTVKHPNQTAGWGRGRWLSEHAWLDDNVPPRVVL